MSHAIYRKSAIRSLQAFTNVCERLGYGTPTVTDGVASIMPMKDGRHLFTNVYPSLNEPPVPLTVNLKSGEVGFDHDLTSKCMAFFAQVAAEQARLEARKAGYQVKVTEQIVKGRKKLVVEIEA